MQKAIHCSSYISLSEHAMATMYYDYHFLGRTASSAEEHGKRHSEYTREIQNVDSPEQVTWFQIQRELKCLFFFFKDIFEKAREHK